MAEYINRNELVENLEKFAPEHLTPLIRNLVEKQPAADVVEVVRCGQCLHSRYIYSPDAFECRKHNGCLKYPNDFCSYGERRTDNDL